MFSPNFVSLDLDVLSHLVTFVSSREDILALGLTNKQLFSLALPELRYRVIRCDLVNIPVWKHLIDNPAKASRVRQLALQGEWSKPQRKPDMLPFNTWCHCVAPPFLNENLRPLTHEELEYCERLLIQAIRVMVNLETFSWTRWPPFIRGSMSPSDGRASEEDIWIAIKNHTKLHEFFFDDYQGRGMAYHSTFTATMLSLRNLTEVDLKINHWDVACATRYFVENDLTLLRGLLHGCPNLQSLSLAIPDWHRGMNTPWTDLTPVLSTAHWPHLHTLRLKQIFIDSRVMTAFLNSSQQLRVLVAHLCGGVEALPFNLNMSPITSIRDGALPKLEVLEVPRLLVGHILKATPKPSIVYSLGLLEPCDWGAPMIEEGVSPSILGVDPATNVPVKVGPIVFENLRKVSCNIQSFSQLERLIEVTPNLECISIETFPWALKRRDFRRWLPYFSHWKRLTTIEGIEVMPGVTKDFLCELRAACPMLTLPPLSITPPISGPVRPLGTNNMILS